MDSISGTRYSTYEESSKWTAFSWQQPDGTRIDVQADVHAKEFNSFDTTESRLVAIDHYETALDSNIVEQISMGNFELNHASSAGGGIQDYSLNADGLITDASGVTVTIDTDPLMQSKQVVSGIDSASIPFNGKIRLSASNGAELT